MARRFGKRNSMRVLFEKSIGARAVEIGESCGTSATNEVSIEERDRRVSLERQTKISGTSQKHREHLLDKIEKRNQELWGNNRLKVSERGVIRVVAYLSRLLDEDNLSAKAIIDCLRENGLIINDDRRYVKRVIYEQVKCVRGSERTVVQLWKIVD